MVPSYWQVISAEQTGCIGQLLNQSKTDDGMIVNNSTEAMLNIIYLIAEIIDASQRGKDNVPIKAEERFDQHAPPQQDHLVQ